MSSINVDTISDTAGSGSPNFPNGVDSTKIRLSSTAGINLTSLNHAFQVGTVDSTVNLRIDRDEIQTVDNGVASQLRVNTRGGEVLIGKAGGTDAVNLRGVIRHNGVDVRGTVVKRSGAFTGLTTASRVFSFDHGESTAPDLVFGELIVNVATSGYAVGDVVKLSSIMEIDEDDYVLSFSGNSTSIVMATNNTYTIRTAAVKTPVPAGSPNKMFFTLSDISIKVVGVWF